MHEVSWDAVRKRDFDCVLFQHRDHFARDRDSLLTPAQRALSTVFVEHDPPQGHPTDTLHPVQDREVLLVHVTPFNALMWDSGITPACVVEHGVLVDPHVHYTGTLARGISVVNHLSRRGRRLGSDLFAAMRERVPLDLVGMDATSAGGIGEIPNPELAAFMSRYRFFFHPIRYTSLGLAVVEAMAIGMPVVGLATTELAAVIDRGQNGYVDTDADRLVEVMRKLLEDPVLAARWGARAAKTARERFGIDRFVADWERVLRSVTA